MQVKEKNKGHNNPAPAPSIGVLWIVHMYNPGEERILSNPLQIHCIHDAPLGHERDQEDERQEEVIVSPRRDMTDRSDRCKYFFDLPTSGTTSLPLPANQSSRLMDRPAQKSTKKRCFKTTVRSLV